MNKLISAATALAALTASAGPTWAAPKEEVLYDFKGHKGGSVPLASLTPYNGDFVSLYSSMNVRKTFGGGYELNLDAHHRNKVQIIWKFSRSDANPAYSGLVSDTNGNLYGTTLAGHLFELVPPQKGQTTWSYNNLYDFPVGYFPVAGVTFGADGALYGPVGGCSGTFGCIMRFTPNKKGKWTGAELYDFTSGNDAYQPAAPISFGPGGAIYGTTEYGGGGTQCNNSLGCGTVYQLTPPAQGQTNWTEAVLYAFTGGADGANPLGGVTFDQAGNLYSTTYSNYVKPYGGVAFELSPPAQGQTAWTYTQIYAFRANDKDAALPTSGMVFDAAGRLYGTTYSGGSAGAGAVYQLTPPHGPSKTWTETVLYSFGSHQFDGLQPWAAPTFDGNNVLLGTTSNGGRGFFGTIWRLKF
jgi:uncharacterized repeat protein (TIGR03803 family)